VFSYEFKLRGLGAVLLCAGGLLLVAPTPALAGRPVVLAGEPGLVQSTSKTTALTEAEVSPEEQATKYHVAWSSVASSWCTNHGLLGTPEHETPPIEISATTSFAVEHVELTGLKNAEKYCVAAIATNASGSAQSEQATFTAGAPSVVFFAEPAAVTSTTFTAHVLVDPAHQATHYWVEYELASLDSSVSAGQVHRRRRRG
jgi:hypothetical protein